MLRLFSALIISFLLFSSPAQAATQLKDEGTSQGYINIIDCTGSGISCSRSGITGTFSVTGGSVTNNPGGSTNAVQYNSGGAFGGSTLNATATNKYLRQVSSGVPSFVQIPFSDLSSNYTSSLSDAAGISVSGTLVGNALSYAPHLDPTTFTGNQTWDDGATDASITLGYNLSGATDPTWTIGNNSMNLSTGVLKYGGNTVATSANNLSFFSSTTSAQLATLLSDETGSGAAVFGTSPTLTTAILGSSTATTQTQADNSTKVATTAYVDLAVLGQNYKEAAKYASTAALPAVVYSSGAGTLTGVALGAISLDSSSPSVADRVLIKNQASSFQNGIYTVTAAGSGAAVFVLTRTSDANTSVEFKTGDSIFITSGSTLSSTSWAYTGIDSPNFTSDAITYAQIAGQGSFTATNGVSISGTTISGVNSIADGSTLGVASFVAADFNSSSGNISLDYTNGQKASSSVPGFSTANQTIGSFGITIDGGGSAITTGVKGYVEVPFACTIVRATTLADQSGSIVIDVWKDTYANYPPTVADTITASAKPTISSATKAQDSTLTGWTTSVSAGDVIGFNVDSATTVTRVTLVLKCNRT